MADLIFAALDATLPAPAGGREQGRFKAEWTSTVALLEDELDKVGARSPTLYVDVPKAAITRKGEITGGIRAVRTSGVRLEFEKRVRGKGDTWAPALFPRATYWTAQHNVRAIALTLGALRDIARWGGTEDDQQYAGFLKLPAPGGVNTTAVALSPERAARILVDLVPTFAQVTAAARDAIARDLLVTRSSAVEVADHARRLAHPDAGGSDAAFVTVQEARRVLLHHHGVRP